MAKVRINSEKLTPFGGFFRAWSFYTFFWLLLWGEVIHSLCYWTQFCLHRPCFFVGADIESFVYFPLGLQNISCLWLVLWVMSISARDRLAVFGWRYIAFLSHLLLMSCISRRSLHFWWRVNYPRWWTFFPPSWVVHAWPFISGRTYDVLLQMHDMSWCPKVEYALACYLATWQNGV